MKHWLYIIFLLAFSTHLAAQGITVSGNTIIVGNTHYYIAKGIKIYDDYIKIGSVKVEVSDLSKFYIVNDNTLVFGKTRYKLTKNDRIDVFEPETPKKIIEEKEDDAPQQQDDIIELRSDIYVNKDKCTIIKGSSEYSLSGKVKIVDSGEDFRVKIVDSWEDIVVRIDDSGNSCCCFKLHDDFFEDVKVKIVDWGEDIKVKIVDVFHSVSY